MRKKSLLLLLSILVICSLSSLAEANRLTLPLSSYWEIERDNLSEQANKMGWENFYTEYKDKFGFEVYNTGPYGGYLIYPHLPALFWVESRMSAEINQQNLEWAEQYYQQMIDSFTPRILFQVFIISGKPIQEENLIVNYRDNTGLDRRIGLEDIEIKQELSGQQDYYYLNSIVILSPETRSKDLRWFNLSLMKDNSTAEVDFRWNFTR